MNDFGHDRTPRKPCEIGRLGSALTHEVGVHKPSNAGANCDGNCSTDKAEDYESNRQRVRIFLVVFAHNRILSSVARGREGRTCERAACRFAVADYNIHRQFVTFLDASGILEVRYLGLDFTTTSGWKA